MSAEISAFEILSTLLSTPATAFVFVIQVLLGMALGYLAVKALKYLLAMLGIIVLGSLLSLWSLEQLSKEALSKIGVTLELLKSIGTTFMAILVGPIALGFVIGIIVALVSK